MPPHSLPLQGGRASGPTPWGLQPCLGAPREGQGAPTGLGPGGSLQELHGPAVGVQDGAQEAAEEEEESREALGLAQLRGIHGQVWGRPPRPQASPGGSGGSPQYLVALLRGPLLGVTVAVISEGAQGPAPQEGPGGHVTGPALTLHLWGQRGVTAPQSHPVPVPQERPWAVTHLHLLQQPPQDQLVQDVQAVVLRRLAGLGTQVKG